MGKERKRRLSSKDYPRLPWVEEPPKKKDKRMPKVPVSKPPKIARSKIPRGKADLYHDDAGNLLYPPRDGFKGKIKSKTLKRNTYIDRYGYSGGSFVAPIDTPYEERSLPPGTRESKPYKVYRVLRAQKVESGKIAPAFGERGGGIQYKFPKPIADLTSKGVLEEVSST